MGEGITTEQMRGMLLLRQAEQQRQLGEEHARLSRLTTRIRLIEQENHMTYEVVLKSIPNQWIASTREIIPSYPAVGMLYEKVRQALGPAATSINISVALWHDREYKETNVDAEAGFYLKELVAASAEVKVYELTGSTVASTIHNGSYQRLSQAYDALLRWVAANDYQVAGPVRELYLHCVQPVRLDDESYVTEIQIPVQKDTPIAAS